MDVPGVVGYEAMSVSDGQYPPGSAPTRVSANMNIVMIEVDDYTVPVTFTVTSLAAGNEICFTSQTSE